MESETANTPLLAPTSRQGISGGRLRNRAVESRVEYRDLGNARQQAPGLPDRAQRGRVVDHVARLEGEDGPRDLGVDYDGITERRAAVDDAMGDRRHLARADVGQRRDRFGG